MRYFTVPGETKQLTEATRRSLRGSFVRLSAGVTQYELRGPSEGELVVLVGGLTVPLDASDGFVALLHARGYRTLAYSCYGRGFSDRVRVDYDQNLFSTQLSELLPALRLGGQHHFVGSSMGALIALAHCGKHPQTASTLTLIGPAGMARASLPQFMARSARPLMPLLASRLGARLLRGHTQRNVRQPELQSKLASLVLEAFKVEGSMHALISTLSHFRLDGRSDLYRAVADKPFRTLLIWGEDDEVTPVSGFDDAVLLMRPTESYVIAKCGHMVGMEQPQKVLDMFCAIAQGGTRPTTTQP